MLSSLGISLLKTKPVDFYLKDGSVTADNGEESFRWRKITLDCISYTDNARVDENEFRYHFRERLTCSIPKGNDDIDFTGCIVYAYNNVFVAEGNATRMITENTPGRFDRTLGAWREATVSLPSADEINEYDEFGNLIVEGEDNE